MARTLTRTHTFAELEVSEAVRNEIAEKLRSAGYDHAFVDGAIDMHGIGLVLEKEAADGYRDGRRGEPAPGGNRSPFYRHGYESALNDRARLCGVAAAQTAAERRQAWDKLIEQTVR